MNTFLHTSSNGPTPAMCRRWSSCSCRARSRRVSRPAAAPSPASARSWPTWPFYVFALTQMNGVDLDSEIEQKITKNARRQYTPDSHGVLVRVPEGPAPELTA